MSLVFSGSPSWTTHNLAQFGGLEFKTNTRLRRHRGFIISKWVHVMCTGWTDQQPQAALRPPRPDAVLRVVLTAQRLCFPDRGVVVWNGHLCLRQAALWMPSPLACLPLQPWWCHPEVGRVERKAWPCFLLGWERVVKSSATQNWWMGAPLSRSSTQNHFYTQKRRIEMQNCLNSWEKGRKIKPRFVKVSVPGAM